MRALPNSSASVPEPDVEAFAAAAGAGGAAFGAGAGLGAGLAAGAGTAAGVAGGGAAAACGAVGQFRHFASIRCATHHAAITADLPSAPGGDANSKASMAEIAWSSSSTADILLLCGRGQGCKSWPGREGGGVAACGSSMYTASKQGAGKVPVGPYGAWGACTANAPLL